MSIVMMFSRAVRDLVMHGHDELRADVWIGEDLRKEAWERVRKGECKTGFACSIFSDL